MNEPTAICPCDQVIFPLPVANVPGKGFISYRWGTYADFRAALLRNDANETELIAWSPTKGDLGLQLVEWFAYLADILTFYNEQAANNAYLATAFLPGTIEQIVRVLGYRPRPGIGAKGVVGAILGATNSGAVTIPVGFAVQSKPEPAPPQVFELDSAKPIVVPAVGELPVHIEPAAHPGGLTIAAHSGVLLQGVVTGIKPQDELMIAPMADLAAPESTLINVTSVETEADAAGNKNTRVKLADDVQLASDPTGYALFRSTQSMGTFRLIPYHTINGIHLESLARSLAHGDAVAIPRVPGVNPGVNAVGYYSEEIAFVPGESATVPKIPFPHSVIELQKPLPQMFIDRILFGFRRIAPLIREPVPSPVWPGDGLTLTPDETPRPDVVTDGASTIVLDADGNGLLGEVTSPSGAAPIEVAVDEPRNLKLPLSLLFALIPVSRGKTVSKEVIGSGDATIAGQVFTLQKAPLTYFPGPDPSFPTSTLRVAVNGVLWKEVRSFYEQPANAQIYVTRQTIDQKTQVIFGDGLNGARLPTGTDNVVATYRYGSGRQSPPAGSLTTILKPVPGLKSVKNPVAVSGGDDPQSPDKIREYAPQSVLTFGRAISESDYEAIAAQAPAVTRAKTYYAWDAQRQRALVKVYVGDDEAAVVSARRALDTGRDRNQPLQVLLADEVTIGIAFSLVVDSRYDEDEVRAAVTDLLLDPDTGLFSPKRLHIGERLYESRVVAAILGIPGTVAVHQLRLGPAQRIVVDFFRRAPQFIVKIPPAQAVLDPGEGGFFTLGRSNVSISTESADV